MALLVLKVQNKKSSAKGHEWALSLFCVPVINYFAVNAELSYVRSEGRNDKAKGRGGFMPRPS
jgi:type VI protein secretion system component VasA